MRDLPDIAAFVRRVTASAALTLIAVFSIGCGSEATDGVVCPPLAPGALAQAAVGGSLDPLGNATSASGSFATGELTFHAVWVPQGARFTATVSTPDAPALAMAYGPRNLQGGVAGCTALSIAESDGTSAAVSLDARAEGAGGEYLVMVGLAPGERQLGDPPVSYSISIRCIEGCDTAAPCATLTELGCPTIRCDGELLTDDDGCPSCTCDSGALCDSGYSPGPGQSCVSPGCFCPEPTDPDAEAVCGADGETHASACHALCAGVAVLKNNACETACPSVVQCESPCYGLRAVDSGGCPSCECAPSIPAAPVDCAACSTASEPVCGTDGVTYPSRCHARCAGVKLLYASECHPTCLAAPGSCNLDCEWGYVLGESPEACLQCACENPPSAVCVTRGEPVCVDMPAFDARVTVGSACLALHIGATDGVWGSCGQPCSSDADCSGAAPSRCVVGGVMEGRCVVATEGQTCGCAGLIDPVCGADGVDYDNACFAACAGVSVAHRGSCCEESAAELCPDDAEVAELDTRGCATGACVAPRVAEDLCRSEPPQVDSCAPDGAQLTQTACEAHMLGVEAANAWCVEEVP